VVEDYRRQGVLDHRHLVSRAVDDPGDAGIRLCERRFVGKLVLRGRPTKRFRDAVKKALGHAPPETPNTVAEAGTLRILWLGPDEWLVTTPPGEETATHAALTNALASLHAAVTDVTEGRAVIGLSGVHARDLLAKGCPLDLHPWVFKPGDCAQSLYAKALILLHQIDDTPSYDIFIERSMADYLWAWLEDGAQEYGLAIVHQG